MTARATITAAAMREAIAAVSAGLVRVVMRPDGTTIIEPANTRSDDADPHGTQPIDLVTWKKPAR